MRIALTFLSALVLLQACETRAINTSQPLTVDVIGTDEASCVLSTPYNRYLLYAPDTATIERSSADLKIDCRGNAGMRRVIVVKPEFDGLYYRYPESVTVNFSFLEEGSRYNGFRAPDDQFNAVIRDVMTEDSFNMPVETGQTYPVPRTHGLGRRSHPVALD